MISEIKQHKLAYLVLVLALLSFIAAFLHAWPNVLQQKIVAVVMGSFYFLWGIMTHQKQNHINSRVVFEYLAVSILAVLLLFLLLQ